MSKSKSERVFIVMERSESSSYPKYFKIARSGPDPRVKLNKLKKGNPRHLDIHGCPVETDDAEDVRSKAITEIQSKVPRDVGFKYCDRGWFKYTAAHDPLPTAVQCIQDAADAQ